MKCFLLDVLSSFAVLLVVACIPLLIRFVFSEQQHEKESQLARVNVDLKDESDKPSDVLVFTAPWCAACKLAEPEITKLEENYRIVRIDIDADPDSARKYNIEAVPTFIVHPGASNDLRTHDVEEVLEALKQDSSS